MSDRPQTGGGPDERLEAALRRAARQLPYPPTPDFTRPRPAPRPRLRWVWAAALALAAVITLLSVPAARAALVEFLQIGGVRVFVGATPTPPPTATAGPVTPAPTPTLPPALRDLYGRSTLADARRLADFPILLPSYPADLGEPDEVFVQLYAEPAVILVWLDQAQPDRVRLALHILPASAAFDKLQPPVVRAAEVNGQPAVWTEGPYFVQQRNGNLVARGLVTGHVLVWAADGLTYRLETDLPLEAALLIAASLK